MNNKSNLDRASKVKNDEFYTQYKDIEFEINRYKDYFNGKSVLCNCNDAESEFYNYFHTNFKYLGLKELICVHYNKTQGRRLFGGVSYYKRYCGGDYSNLEDCDIVDIHGNGSFDSKECVDLMKKCDIVITNPPFSLFDELFTLIFRYKRDYMLISHIMKLSIKSITDKLIQKKMYLDFIGQHMDFVVNHDIKNYDKTKAFERDGKNYVKLQCCWFTNLKRDRCITNYSTVDKPLINYRKYDNYDAIHVDGGLNNIPNDYIGNVSLSFGELYKIVDSNYEIVDIAMHPYMDGKELFKRVIVRRND